jgi:hypothetical protein
LPPRIGRWKAAKQRAARCSQSKPNTGQPETAPVTKYKPSASNLYF